MNLIMFDVRLGALTELWAGFSKDITVEQNNGGYIIPWGRLGEPRADIKKACVNGDSGKKLWDFLEREVQLYLQ